jgi:tetratricopeptide (TPR) repeat protein
LADLASKSLLTANRDTGRYAIHELLRQYAEEFLLGVDAIRGQTVDAYVGYYSDMAAAAERTIVSGRQVEAMTTMEDDIENFRAAWRRSLEGGDARAARRFVLALWCLYEVRGWHQAADSLFSQALVELPETDTDEATIIAREAARGVLGKFVTYLGNPKAGAEMSAIAADRLATTTDRFAELMSLEAWCDGLAYLGAWTEIREVAIKAIDLAESSGATWWRAGMPNWLGIAESQLGNFESAEAAIEDGNARLTELDDQFFMAWNVMVRATMAAMSGQLDVAATSNEKLVELSRSLGFQRTLQFGLQGLGDAKAAAGDHEQALGAFLECLAASYEMGAVVEVAGLMTRIAVVHVEMGRHEKAIEILASVLADPVRDQKMINETESIDTMATRAMASAEDQLDSDAAESARTKGANTPLSEAARSLLEVLHGEIEPNGGTRTRQLTA